MAKITLPLWKTITRGRLESVFCILHLLIRAGALPSGHTEVYFDEVLTIQGVLNYAQGLVYNDEFWKQITVPVPETPPLTKERLARMPSDLARLLEGTPPPCSWEDVRKELKLFLTLCDQDIGVPAS